MKYNYNRLNGRIIEKFGKNKNFAIAMAVSERTLSLKMNAKIDFKQSEIIKACTLLEVPVIDIPAYFFDQKTQLN